MVESQICSESVAIQKMTLMCEGGAVFQEGCLGNDNACWHHQKTPLSEDAQFLQIENKQYFLKQKKMSRLFTSIFCIFLYFSQHSSTESVCQIDHTSTCDQLLSLYE